MPCACVPPPAPSAGPHMPVRLLRGAGLRFAAVTGGLFHSGVRQPPGDGFCAGGACASDRAVNARSATGISRTPRSINRPPPLGAVILLFPHLQEAALMRTLRALISVVLLLVPAAVGAQD